MAAVGSVAGTSFAAALVFLSSVGGAFPKNRYFSVKTGAHRDLEWSASLADDHCIDPRYSRCLRLFCEFLGELPNQVLALYLDSSGAGPGLVIGRDHAPVI